MPRRWASTRRCGAGPERRSLHPEGDQLFTLYTLPQTGEPVFDPAHRDEPLHAFIHTINLKENWSFCTFLPEPIGTVDEATVGMGISPSGDEVIVVDPSTSTLARVDTSELTVIESLHVEKLRDADAKAAVAITDDGPVYIGSGSMLLELDATRAAGGTGMVAGGAHLGTVGVRVRRSAPSRWRRRHHAHRTRHRTGDSRAPRAGTWNSDLARPASRFGHGVPARMRVLRGGLDRRQGADGRTGPEGHQGGGGR